jgi:hypothetical protein
LQSVSKNRRKKFIERKRSEGKRKIKKKAYNGEFDPGSG